MSAAADEMSHATSEVRTGLRWHSYELLASAVFLSGTVFVYGSHRPHLQLWLFVTGPILLAGVGIGAWRRRIVGRPEVRMARVAMLVAIFLLSLSFIVLGQLVSGKPSGWTVAGLAAAPSIPLLIAAFRMMFK